MIIQVNKRIFKVLKLLGKGKGGYSYLVADNERKYVVKKIHHEPCEYYQFGNKLQSEISDYEKLSQIGINVPVMYEIDTEREHILKEYIDGDTIYEMIKQDYDINRYVIQLKQMCNRLYGANINIDYFPTNFVTQNGILYYIDYECNKYMDEWNFENWGIKYWSKTDDFIEYMNNEKESNKEWVH